MTAETITTRTAEICIRADGIAQVVTLPNVTETLEDAKVTTEVVTRLNGQKSVPLLVDIRQARAIDGDARTYYSSKENLVFIKALALLVESSVSRLMANFFINFSKPAVPTRLFTSEAEAVAWLKTFL